MLNKAVAWGHLQANPLRGLKGLREPPGRLRYLTPEEKSRLLDACGIPPYLRPLVELSLHTGMRRGELLQVRWADIDLRRRTMTLTHTKNNERRLVPMNDTVAEILKALPRHLDTDLLFPGITGPMVTRAFMRARHRAGLLNVRFHDLRHTFASYLAMGGYNLRTIQQLLGHRDLRMTSRYSHLSADHLQQAVKSLDTALGDPSELPSGTQKKR